jgi:hypothetical protein
MKETKMQKVLKRIGALPPLPDEDKFDIKKRASEILKSWQPHLEEITEIAKKDEGKEKDEKAAEETKKEEGEPMEEVETAENPADMDSTEKPVEDKSMADEPMETQPTEQAKENKSEPMDTTSADVTEDFVMIESGGEADQRAQEKATESVEGEVKDSSAGADPKEAVVASAPQATYGYHLFNLTNKDNE